MDYKTNVMQKKPLYFYIHSVQYSITWLLPVCSVQQYYKKSTTEPPRTRKTENK